MKLIPFTDRDFDAYLPGKWQSNVFNRERLEVKEKLKALGRFLAPSLHAADGSPLECEVSAEHPALWNQRRVQNQHLFFSRSRASRGELEGIISKQRTMAALIDDPSPLRNHIFLAVMIDKDRLELGLKLHSDAAVDRENLQRKCQEYFSREKLLALVNGLSDGYMVGLEGVRQHPAAELNDEQLVSLVRDFPGAGSWLSVTFSIPRADPRPRGHGFEDLCREHLLGLLPLMHFIAWQRENDFVSMRNTLRQEEKKKKSRGLEKRDQVRVVKGVFAGKQGVVEEVDDKGGLKVRLGTMAVKIDPSDVSKL